MKEFGLIGTSLRHSFSKDYFNQFFEDNNIDACYKNYELDSIEELPKLIEKNNLICGLNVTIPFKQVISSYLDAINPKAKEVGAVNVIEIIRENGHTKLIGHNTDILGFKYSISPMLKKYHTDALILGTGGASKAVDFVLRELSINTLFVSRSKKSKNKIITYNELNEDLFKKHLLIINCTPCGTWPNIDTYPPINYQWATSKHIFYDLVYNPQLTSFMQKAKEKGATIKNGLEMLHLQAEYAWKIWNSNKSDI